MEEIQTRYVNKLHYNSQMCRVAKKTKILAAQQQILKNRKKMLVFGILNDYHTTPLHSFTYILPKNHNNERLDRRKLYICRWSWSNVRFCRGADDLNA